MLNSYSYNEQIKTTVTNHRQQKNRKYEKNNFIYAHIA